MELQLKKFRKPHQNAVVIPWQDFEPGTGKITSRGHVKFSSIGDTQEVPDAVGYGILRSYGDIIEQVSRGSEPVRAAKRAQAPSNK